MFSVNLEVLPNEGKKDAYLELAKHLKPILEKVDGFVDNERFESRLRPGWVLSHSTWRDEKSVVRWRTAVGHHLVQEKGRGEILLDYRLRVGQVTGDTRVPEGHALREQRLDETEVGEGTTVSLIEPLFVQGVARWRIRILCELTDAQMVVEEDMRPRFSLRLVVPHRRAPADNGLLVAPDRERQHPAVARQTLVKNVVNETVDPIQFRPQHLGIGEIDLPLVGFRMDFEDH